MTALEEAIEKRLRKMVERHGGLCLKWVCPGWTGVPDRIVLMPGGRVHFVELKRPKGGRVSAMQAWWHKRLTALGFDALYILNEADIAAFEEKLQTKDEERGTKTWT